MKLSLNNMRGREEYLRKLIEDKAEALKNAPDGNLKVSYSHGKLQYKQYFGKDKKELYIPAGKTELVRQLAQKAYDENVLKKAIREKRNISSLVELYERGNCDDVFESLFRSPQFAVCVGEHNDFHLHPATGPLLHDLLYAACHLGEHCFVQIVSVQNIDRLVSHDAVFQLAPQPVVHFLSGAISL